MTKFNTSDNKQRDDLAGEHKLNDPIQIILFIIFFAIWILDTFIFHFSHLPLDGFPNSLRISLSIVIFILGGLLAQSGLHIVFKRHRNQPKVIREGVFKIIRHPIYLGAIIFYLIPLICRFSIAAAFFWIIIILYYNFMAKYEEKLLLQKFGLEYKKYKNDVPMWIPRFWKRK